MISLAFLFYLLTQGIEDNLYLTFFLIVKFYFSTFGPLIFLELTYLLVWGGDLILLYFLCIGKHSSGNIYQAILSLTDLQHHVCYVRCTESGPSLCSIPLVHFLFSYFKMMVHAQLLCCVWLFATLWPVARQASLSMGFSRQEYWSGLLFPSPGENDDK